MTLTNKSELFSLHLKRLLRMQANMNMSLCFLEAHKTDSNNMLVHNLIEHMTVLHKTLTDLTVAEITQKRKEMNKQPCREYTEDEDEDEDIKLLLSLMAFSPYMIQEFAKKHKNIPATS